MKRTPPLPIRPLRVLLVEDSPEDCEIVVRELARHDYAVVHERVETQCEMQFALDRKPWDLVVADSALPGFSGLAALRLLHERGESVPLIMVSGSGDDQAIGDALRAGARDFIDKRQLARLGSAVDRELRMRSGVDSASGENAAPPQSSAAGTSSWSDAKDWLTTHRWPSLSETAAILEGVDSTGDDWIEELSFQEIQMRPKVNDVVAALCRDAHVPPLEPLLRCLVALRLEYARGVAIGFAAAELRFGNAPATFLPRNVATLETKLRWMLIDSWELTGCFQWEAISYWLADWRRDAHPGTEGEFWTPSIPSPPIRSRRRRRRSS